VSNSDSSAATNLSSQDPSTNKSADGLTNITDTLSAIATDSLPTDLAELAQIVQTAAKRREGDCLALLALLRLLNELHYDIRETLFRESLPTNRQRLYRLIKDIEQEGGWPYIRRMKLVALLACLEEIEETEEINAEDEAMSS